MTTGMENKIMKKALLITFALAIAVATVPMFAAFEAHVINVTAHIENALRVHTEELAFGTVFPQEYLELNFDIDLSDSFQGQDRVGVVEYVIKQKPKCICTEAGILDKLCVEGEHAAVNYWNDECPAGFEEMLDLCEFLSKTDAPWDDEGNDTSHPSYFVAGDPDSCRDVSQLPDASGVLIQHDDPTDSWIVDLKVPPVKGNEAQDWPEGCPTVAEDSQDYGCDLWIEVTGIYGDQT